MTRQEFEQVVAECLANLPPEFRDRVENVSIQVEEWPDHDTLHRAGLSHRGQLLGFYHGIPLGRRGRGYHLAAPDRISIYRRPILSTCRDESECRERIRHVLLHELAHYFGIDDDRLREMGVY